MIFFRNEAETCDWAAAFAGRLNPGDTVTLSGELGAGKSVLARALMRALGVTDSAMPSPTFAIIQTYKGAGCEVAHMDWYRLEDSDEIEMLGVRDYFAPPWIAVIEWPERAPGLLPERAWRLQLDVVADEPKARRLTVLGPDQ